MWLREHQDRITASNFGKIIFRKALPSEAFLTNLFTSFNKTIIAASITYGCRHERTCKGKIPLGNGNDLGNGINLTPTHRSGYRLSTLHVPQAHLLTMTAIVCDF